MSSSSNNTWGRRRDVAKQIVVRADPSSSLGDSSSSSGPPSPSSLHAFAFVCVFVMPSAGRSLAGSASRASSSRRTSSSCAKVKQTLTCSWLRSLLHRTFSSIHRTFSSIHRTNSSTGRQCKFKDWVCRSNIHVLFIHQVKETLTRSNIHPNLFLGCRARTRISGIVRDPRLDMFQDQCRLQVQTLTRSGPVPFYAGPFLDAEEELENRACWSRNTNEFLAPFPSGSFVIFI